MTKKQSDFEFMESLEGLYLAATSAGQALGNRADKVWEYIYEIAVDRMKAEDISPLEAVTAAVGLVGEMFAGAEIYGDKGPESAAVGRLQ
ncbi:MAG: hypothetical protein EKK42_32840 [Pseudonocardiaceae bacterium]|nr:MAG: hypothetical protein EKK42_32840 [Pseudonocardiaceae bacterium]